ncbi:MAG: WS/DGAT domain-containing protein [Actinomycetota bacterium]|nr:WS/DGAT domain-containing protein [Actinomycetota bacterium]
MLQRLSSEDARILALETPAVVGHTAKVVIAERAADDTAAVLRDRLGSRLGLAPRLRQRLAPTPLGLAPPAWVDDPSFDPAVHVRRFETTGPVDRDRLRAIVATLMRERLDRARPLWAIDIVEPLEENLVAAVWRIHHCLADGTGILALGPVLLWDDASTPPGRATRSTPAPVEPPPGPFALVAAAASDRVQGLAFAAVRTATGLVTPSRWRQTVAELRRAPGTIARELRPTGGSSPLDTETGRQRLVAFVGWPLADVQRAAHAIAAGVTVNDVVLAGVAGGLRRWLQLRDRPLERLRVKIPVSMHETGEDARSVGNRDSFLNIDLPLDEPDPVRRLLAINAETRDRKDRHDADELYALFTGVSHVSPRLYRRAYRAASDPHAFALAVSNTRGPAQHRYLAGGLIREVYSLAEIAPRHALRVSALSFDGRMSCGLCADADALPDLEILADGIDGAVRELFAKAA